MKTLCLTSIAHPALDAVAYQLHASGLAPARPSPRGDGMDIAAWHQRVLARQAGGSGATQLGRLWEQLAADIFMGNLDAPVWGWTEPRSVELLDFWHHFDPQLYFVLLCISPEQALAHAIATPTDAASPAEVLQRWHDTHQAMLRFHLRHPERSVLITADEALAQPARLLDLLVSRWALPLQPQGDAAPMPAAALIDPVAHYLANRLIQGHSAEHALQQEVLASLTPLSDDNTSTTAALTTDLVIAAYRQLCDRSKEAEALERAHAELTTTRFALNKQIADLAQARDEQARLATDRQAQLDALTKDKAALAAELTDAREEGELLLTQLHQVQEELESLFLKEQQTAQQLAAAQADKTSLSAARDTLNKQIADLTKTRDEQTRLATDRQTQLDALTKDKAALAAELTDAREEGELLLTQLHQVQEELEHYFLEHQKLKHERQAQDERWQRMLQRTPDYCDFAILTARPATEPATLDWQLDGLETAGRRIPQLACQTLLIDGAAAIRIPRSAGQALLHWPADTDAAEVLLAPGAEAAQGALARLATSDLVLLQNLATVFQHALQTPDQLQLPADFPAARLQAALAQLPRQLAALPPALRFDRITLRNNQTNPDYEHLWLVLDNLSLGTQRWPQFEFRLSCANVGPRRFGTHPKLEFPQHVGQAPLPGWFDESYDDHGAKLELRFALPDAMDVQIWNRLGPPDHHFLRALIDALPTLLATLQTSGAQISRAWQDWFKLADDSRRILALRAPIANALQD
ncbi:hypothetical protein MXC99_01515 [Thauera aromatica]|uniref:hypothetical protein n=1 Tax=Thauera aromatica TaxID=59405 RepID=UPI001FFC4001|nr:hypothetical protein [Thauera aromatica]MCK2086871.1 hypothetical protein [Thauera aromatica]